MDVGGCGERPVGGWPRAEEGNVEVVGAFTGIVIESS